MSPGRAGAIAACVFAAAIGCAPAHDAGQILEGLQSNDPEARHDANERLARILKSGDHEVFLRGARTLRGGARIQSILYLARFTGPEAQAALRSLLRAEERALIPWNPIRMKPQSDLTDSRILVANLISQNGGDPLAAPVLLEGAEGQDPETFAATLYALGALRDPQAMPLLTTAARHDNPEVARAAVEAVARIRVPEAFEALRGAATHPREQVRIDTLSALEMRTEPEAAEVIRAMATADPSSDLRAAAIRQLARFRQPAVVEFLIERLGNADTASRQAAYETLIAVTGQSFRPDARQWSRWWAKTAAGWQAAS